MRNVGYIAVSHPASTSSLSALCSSHKQTGARRLCATASAQREAILGDDEVPVGSAKEVSEGERVQSSPRRRGISVRFVVVFVDVD